MMKAFAAKDDRIYYVSVFDTDQNYNFGIFTQGKYRLWPNKHLRTDENGFDEGEETVYNNEHNYLRNWEDFKRKVKQYFDFDLLDEFKPWYVK